MITVSIATVDIHLVIQSINRVGHCTLGLPYGCFGEAGD